MSAPSGEQQPAPRLAITDGWLVEEVMAAVLAPRDPSAPLTLSKWPRRLIGTHRPCGYVVNSGGDRCPTPGLYLFRMADWTTERHGLACAAHARIVRTWDGLAWMRSAQPGELVAAGRFTVLNPPRADEADR